MTERDACDIRYERLCRLAAAIPHFDPEQGVWCSDLSACDLLRLVEEGTILEFLACHCGARCFLGDAGRGHCSVCCERTMLPVTRCADKGWREGEKARRETRSRLRSPGWRRRKEMPKLVQICSCGDDDLYALDAHGRLWHLTDSGSRWELVNAKFPGPDEIARLEKEAM